MHLRLAGFGAVAPQPRLLAACSRADRAAALHPSVRSKLMTLSGDGLLPARSSEFASFLNRVNGSPDESGDEFLARNPYLDERLPSSRVDDYDSAGGLADHGTVRPGWARTHDRYLRSHIA